MVDLPGDKAFFRQKRPASRPAAATRLVETAAFGPNPGGLRMLSYAPPGLPSGAPLVVVLHGCTQHGEANATAAGWLQLADRYGLALLVPEQQPANNPNRCFNWFQPEDVRRGQGEAASIRQMIETAVAAHGLDRRRIFVTGLSAGGAMASAMLAAYPEVFAGGGIIAGLPHGAADTVQEAFGAMYQGRSRTPAAWGDLVRGASGHRGPWPRVSIWQGDADATVKPINAEAVASQWLNVHGLADRPSRDTVNGGHRRQQWLAADGQALVELHTLAGLGHGTPLKTSGDDAYGTAGPFLLEAGVSSSLELLRFWGLITSARAEAPQAAPEAEPVTRVFETPVKPRGLDVQAVITRALTAAGLMK